MYASSMYVASLSQDVSRTMRVSLGVRELPNRLAAV